MFIYLFRDESESENLAFSVDMTGENIPPITPYTEWVFLKTINTLTATLRRSAESRQLVALPPHCFWKVSGEFSTGR
jgi:hypothetical protein